MNDNKKIKLVYIVGRGHSGSTLLELLLNSTVGVAAMGELDMMTLQIYRDGIETRWAGTCSCQSRPDECIHWSSVIKDIKEAYGKDLNIDPLAWRLSDIGLEEEFGLRRPLAWILYRFHRLVRYSNYLFFGGTINSISGIYKSWVEHRDFVAQSYASTRQVSVVVDASKDPLQMIDIVNFSSLDVRVLYLTRDVRGLVWSALKKGRSGIVTEAARWSRQNSRILALLEKIDSNKWMHVKYEDLCADSERELEKIHEFLQYDRIVMKPDEELRQRHTIAGNRTRFREIASVREDLAWKQNLDNSQLSKVREIAGRVAKKLGYEV